MNSSSFKHQIFGIVTALIICNTHAMQQPNKEVDCPFSPLPTEIKYEILKDAAMENIKITYSQPINSLKMVCQNWYEIVNGRKLEMNYITWKNSLVSTGSCIYKSLEMITPKSAIILGNHIWASLSMSSSGCHMNYSVNQNNKKSVNFNFLKNVVNSVYNLDESGYKSYQRFVKGKLTYTSCSISKQGFERKFVFGNTVELPIADLDYPLGSKFILANNSNIDDLRICIGYPKENKVKNQYKTEIWITPPFAIEDDFVTQQAIIQDIGSDWKTIGQSDIILCTRHVGGFLLNYHYETKHSLETFESLSKKISLIKLRGMIQEFSIDSSIKFVFPEII